MISSNRFRCQLEGRDMLLAVTIVPASAGVRLHWSLAQRCVAVKAADWG